MKYYFPPNLQMHRFLPVDQECIKHGSRYVSELDTIISTIPENITVKLASASSLQNFVKSDTTIIKKNQYIWGDVLHSFELYFCLVYFRADQMIDSILNDVKAERPVPAAVNARSLLELTLLSSQDMSIIISELTEVYSMNTLDTEVVMYSTDFENLVLRTNWGSRSKDTQAEFRSRDIFKTIKKIDTELVKNDHKAVYRVLYEYLSEFSHPFRNGFLSLVSGNWDDPVDRHRYIIASRLSDAEPSAICLGRTLAATCLASKVLCHYWTRRSTVISLFRNKFLDCANKH